ncbi:MAG: DUF732 domain-containing protein [Mycolicibacter algericus]|uniref:DUF732 domain-containing protein n=1 Tax=Mycolicibacter algericus TaxID=1288388 RepID=UPI003C727710
MITDAVQTEAAQTALEEQPPQAYALEPPEGDGPAWPVAESSPPPAREGQTRWVLSMAALVAAAAALVAAGAFGARMWTTPGHVITLDGPVVTSVQPTRTSTLLVADAETAFLQELDQHQIWGPAAEMVYTGRSLCGSLREGSKRQNLIDAMARAKREATNESKSVGDRNAEVVMNAAVRHLCPDMERV